jgi:hypothetical protein
MQALRALYQHFEKKRTSQLGHSSNEQIKSKKQQNSNMLRRELQFNGSILLHLNGIRDVS